MKKNILQNAKVVLLGLLFSGALAFAWTGPTALPPGNNAPAPINVSAIEQTKAGKLNIGQLFRGNGNIVAGGTATTVLDPWGVTNLGVFQSGSNTTGGLIWAGAEILSGGIQIGALAQNYPIPDANGVLNASRTYPAHLCADIDGTVMFCPVPVGNLAISLSETVHTNTITNSTTIPANYTISLTLTANNLTNCQATQSNGATGGFTGNVSPGAFSATVRYGTTDFSVTCQDAGGSPQTATASFLLKGINIFNQGGFTGSVNLPASVTQITQIKLWGAGAGGGYGEVDDGIHGPHNGGSGSTGEYRSATPAFSNWYQVTLGTEGQGDTSPGGAGGSGGYTQINGGAIGTLKTFGGNGGTSSSVTLNGVAGSGCSGGSSPSPTVTCITGGVPNPASGANNGHGAGGAGGDGSFHPDGADGEPGRIEVYFQ